MLKHLGFSSGAVPPFVSLGSVMMWMLFLFNRSPTFRVCCITAAAFSLMDVRFLFLPHVQVFAEDPLGSSRFPLWVSFPCPVALVVRLWSVLAVFLSGLLANFCVAGLFETELHVALVGLLLMPFSGFLFVSARSVAVPQCEFQGPFLSQRSWKRER